MNATPQISGVNFGCSAAWKWYVLLLLPPGYSTFTSTGTIGGPCPMRPGDADGLVGRELAALLGQRAELEAGGQVGDDAVDPAAAHRQGDRALVVERVAEAEDAIAEHFGAGADGGQLGHRRSSAGRPAPTPAPA